MKFSKKHAGLAVAIVALIGTLVLLFTAFAGPAHVPGNDFGGSARPASIDLPPPRIGYIETTPMHIDRVYPSMEGPHDRIVVNTSEIDWITAFKTEVVDTVTNEPMGRISGRTHRYGRSTRSGCRCRSRVWMPSIRLRAARWPTTSRPTASSSTD